MPPPTVLTVILNYRTAPMTLRAAEAARTAMVGLPGAVVIVDNDSQDGSFEELSRAVAARGWDTDGQVRVLQTGHNGGFGAGCNSGIRSGLPDGTAPDYIYLLNSDAFPAPDAIRRLRDHLQAHPQTGLAGSYIHGPDGEAHVTAFRFPGIVSEFISAACTGVITRLLSGHDVVLPVPDTTRAVDWLAGASMMLRREMLDHVGFFDEGFFLYFEETDLCRRARNAGWRTDYVRSAEVMHIGSVSTGAKQWTRKPGYWFDSRRRYFVKHLGRAGAAGATLARLAGGAIWQTRRLVERKPRAGPERFLRDMLASDLGAAVAALRPRSAIAQQAHSPTETQRPQRSRE